MEREPDAGPLFGAFALIGLSSKQPLTTVTGDPGWHGTDARYVPSVLEVLPQESERKLKLPPQLAICSLPAGVEIIPAGADPVLLMPKVYSIVLTGEDGARLYAACLAFYEDVPPGVAAMQRDAWGAHATKAMCLVSRQPYLASMEGVLRTLYAATFVTGPAASVPDSLAMLLALPAPTPAPPHAAPAAGAGIDAAGAGEAHIAAGSSAGALPPSLVLAALDASPFAAADAVAARAAAGGVSAGGVAGAVAEGCRGGEGGVGAGAAVAVEFTLEGRPFRLLPPAPATGEPVGEAPLRPLLEVLGVDNLVRAWVGVALERRVLLRASSNRLLALAGEGLRQLLHPLRLLHTYIPNLPWALTDYCEAPTPFLMGLFVGAEEQLGMSSAGRAQEALVTVDLDRDTVTVRGERDFDAFLDHPALTRLRARLTHLLAPTTAVGDAVLGPGAATGMGGGGGAGATGGGWDAAGSVAAAVVGAGPGGDDPWLRRAADMAHTGWGVCHDNLVRRLFLQAMSALLRGYHAFLTGSKHKPPPTPAAVGGQWGAVGAVGPVRGPVAGALAAGAGGGGGVARESSGSVSSRSSAGRSGQLPLDVARFVAWHEAHSTPGGGRGGALIAALTNTLAFFTFVEEYGKGAAKHGGDPYAWYKTACEAFVWTPAALAAQQRALAVRVVPPCTPAVLRPAKLRAFSAFPPLHMVEAGLMAHPHPHTHGQVGGVGWGGDTAAAAAHAARLRPLARVSSSARARVRGLTSTRSRSMSGDAADATGGRDKQAALRTSPSTATGGALTLLTPTSSMGMGLATELATQAVRIRHQRTSSAHDTGLVTPASGNAMRPASPRAGTSQMPEGGAGGGGGTRGGDGVGSSPVMGVVEAELVRRQTAALAALLDMAPGGVVGAEALEGARALLKLQLGGNGVFLVAKLREAVGLGGGAAAPAALVREVEGSEGALGRGGVRAGEGDDGRGGAVGGERIVSGATFGVLVDMLAAVVGAAVGMEDWGTVASTLQVASCLTRPSGGAHKERVVHHLGAVQPLLFSVWVWCGVVAHALAGAAGAALARDAAGGAGGEGAGSALPVLLAPADTALQLCAAHMMGVGVGEDQAWGVLQWLAYTHVTDLTHRMDPAPAAALWAVAGDMMAGVRTVLRRAKLAARSAHRSRLPTQDVVTAGLAAGLPPPQWPPLELLQPGVSLHLPRNDRGESVGGGGAVGRDAEAALAALLPPVPHGPPRTHSGAKPTGAAVATAAAATAGGSPARPPWNDLRRGSMTTPLAPPATAGVGVRSRDGSLAASRPRAGALDSPFAQRSARSTAVSEESVGVGAVAQPLSPACSPPPPPGSPRHAAAGNGAPPPSVAIALSSIASGRPSMVGSGAPPPPPALQRSPTAASTLSARLASGLLRTHDQGGVDMGDQGGRTPTAPVPAAAAAASSLGALSGGSDDLAPERDSDTMHEGSIGARGASPPTGPKHALLPRAWSPGKEEAMRRAAAYFQPAALGAGTGAVAGAAVTAGGGPVLCMDAVARVVVVGSEEGELRVLRVKDGRLVGVACVPLPPQALLSAPACMVGRGACLVRLAPDGGVAAFAGAGDHSLGVVDTGVGKVVARLLPCHAARVTALHLGASGALLVSAGADDCARVWDVRCPYGGVGVRGAAAAGLVAGQCGVTALAMDGARWGVVTGGRDGSVKAWDLRALAQPTATLVGHSAAVSALLTLRPATPASPADPTPPGPRLVSASADWTVRVWGGAPLGGGEEGCAVVLAGHGGPVTALGVLGGEGDGGAGAMVASGAADGSVAVWDVDGAPGGGDGGDEGHMPSCVWLGAPHTVGVGLVAGSAKGGMMVTGGVDGTVCSWALRHGDGGVDVVRSWDNGTATGEGPLSAASLSVGCAENGSLGLVGWHGGARGIATCMAYDPLAGVVYTGGHRGLLTAWQHHGL